MSNQELPTDEEIADAEATLARVAEMEAEKSNANDKPLNDFKASELFSDMSAKCSELEEFYFSAKDYNKLSRVKALSNILKLL